MADISVLIVKEQILIDSYPRLHIASVFVNLKNFTELYRQPADRKYSRSGRDTLPVLKKRDQNLKEPFSRNSQWSYAGSNRKPPACKAGALPVEL